MNIDNHERRDLKSPAAQRSKDHFAKASFLILLKRTCIARGLIGITRRDKL
jgi:hypothetical protein